MNHGRNICKYLKDIRKNIAEENGIPLEQKECTYNGECSGTCPCCEEELRYLESKLTERIRLGKVATVASIAIGLAACNGENHSSSQSNDSANMENAIADDFSYCSSDFSIGDTVLLPFTGLVASDSNGEYHTPQGRRVMVVGFDEQGEPVFEEIGND